MADKRKKKFVIHSFTDEELRELFFLPKKEQIAEEKTDENDKAE